MVLVGSVVFAGFTGNISTDFGVDLDSQTFGFDNTIELTSDVVISETLVDNAGEGDIWAEIAAELTFGFDFEDVGNEFDASADTDNDPAADGDSIVSNAEITSAKIASDDWYVSILGTMGAPNFATSAIDISSADEEAVDLAAGDYVGGNTGIEVGYMGYTLGFAGNRGLVADTNGLDFSVYHLYGALATPEFALADGISAAFGIAGVLSDDAAEQGGSVSAKVAYADDMMSVSVAADFLLGTGATAADLDFDIAAAIAVDPVTIDVYYASVDDGYSDDMTDYAYAAQDDILSVKAAGSVAGADITLTGKDLLNSTDLGLEVAYAVSDELSVAVNGGFVVDTEVIDFGADVTYTVDAYTATAGFGYNLDSKKFALNASVESSTLVDGATLSIAYIGADLTEEDATLEDDGDLGAITVGASISF